MNTRDVRDVLAIVVLLMAALYAQGCAHLAPWAPVSCSTDTDCSEKFGGEY